METKTHSPKFLKKRRFFLVLPLLVLPFITLMFWALGGGETNDAQAQQTTNGLNADLPDAYLKDDKALDKLSYYEKAATDSARLEELMKNDPYYKHQEREEVEGFRTFYDTLFPPSQYKQKSSLKKGSLNMSPYNNQTYADPNEAKVYKKLNELHTALNQATVKSGATTSNPDITRNNKVPITSDDIDRLEQMMDMKKYDDDSEDLEMKQLNGMMEKILDIQHPERVKEKIKQTSQTNKGQVFAVTTNTNSNNSSLLLSNSVAGSSDTSKYRSTSSGFFSLSDAVEDNIEQQNAVEAVIHETQTLVEGAIVKLRLLNDVFINGILIPKNNFAYGTASLNGERLNIKINSIRYKNSLFPVQLTVVDIDGIEGVYVPGAITRDVAKSSADRAVQGIGFTTIDPSIGAQAASAGIEAAKTLLNKKAKLIKVTVKAGYRVLLRDEKQKVSS